jgi:hypothetical protein
MASFFFGTLFLLVACRQASDPNVAKSATATPMAVHAYENELALDLLYPADWDFQIIRNGLLLFAEPQTLSQQEAGASVAVFRRPPADVRGGLEGALQHYLDSGPLRSGFEATTDLQASQLGGREALQVSIESESDEDELAVKGYIIAAETESGVVYIISATAPLEEWDEQWHAFKLLVGSVEFNE